MTKTKVTKPYKRAYENPIRLNLGEKIELGRHDDEYPGWRWCTNEQGVGGWVPEVILQNGNVASCDYDAIELTVETGEMLTVETRQNGWSREAVNAFHTVAIKNGGSDNGEPGLREHYGPHYYVAFVTDPDGYRIGAVKNDL